MDPSLSPSGFPSLAPSPSSSESPSRGPSDTPVVAPSSMPTLSPVLDPSSNPSGRPSLAPSTSQVPSIGPTFDPSLVCPYAIDLFTAGRLCGILQLGTNKLSMSSGSATGAFGTVCMGPGSQLSRSGSQLIEGDLLAVATASIPSNAVDWTSGTINLNADLDTHVSEAFDLRDQIEAMSCDVTYNKISDIMTGTFNTTGKGVICFEDNDGPDMDTILTGTGDHTVIFKIDILAIENGIKISVQAPLTIEKVIWYIPESSCDDVKIRSDSEISGNILAIGHKVELSNRGKVHGQIISDQDITLSGGSVASCPISTTNTAPP
jgi:hypothetical protein